MGGLERESGEGGMVEEGEGERESGEGEWRVSKRLS